MSYGRVLVTGSSGVLGSALKAIAGEYPECEFVFATSRECDLRDFSSTLAYVNSVKPDAILHLAARSGGIQLSTEHPATLLRDNVLMVINMLEATRLAEVGKLVLTLSSGMYSPEAPLPLKEEHIHLGPAHASNYSYAYAKRLMEPAIRAYRTEFDMNVVGVVPNGIFGENANCDEGSSVMVAALIRRFYENKNAEDPILIWGDGTPLREYTYGQDIARACMWCLKEYNDPQILNIGSTEEHSVRDIAYMIAEILGISQDRIVFDPTKPAGVHRKPTDNSRFLRLSKFQYTPFRVGLERSIRWFCEHYETVIMARANASAARL